MENTTVAGPVSQVCSIGSLNTLTVLLLCQYSNGNITDIIMANMNMAEKKKMLYNTEVCELATLCPSIQTDSCPH